MCIFSGSLGSVQLQLRQVLQQLDKQNVAVTLVKLAVKVPKQKIQSKATGVRMDWYDVPHLSAPVRTWYLSYCPRCDYWPNGFGLALNKLEKISRNLQLIPSRKHKF